MRILITGANGFLGSHLVEKALEHPEHLVYSGIRERANTKYLNGLHTEKVVLDYEDKESLSRTFQLLSKDEKFDFIIHNAGLTKSNSPEENLKVNKGLTENILVAIDQSGVLKKTGKFLYISSLAALGPVGANGPVSSYGRSKLEAEKVIQNFGIPYLIFRPTAIYGPRDHAFLSMFKAAKIGLYPNITARNQKITMIYGPDVAKLVFYYATQEINKIIHLDDGQVYSHEVLKSTLSHIFNKKIILFKVPGLLMYATLILMETWTQITNQKPVLTREKYSEIKKDWDHDFPFENQNLNDITLVPLAEGFLRTHEFYQKHHLL